MRVEEFKKDLVMHMLADYIQKLENEISSQLSDDELEDFHVVLNQNNFHANASYMLYSLSNGYKVKIV